MAKYTLVFPLRVVQQTLLRENQFEVRGFLGRVRAVDCVDDQPCKNTPTEEVRFGIVSRRNFCS